ncbi:nuclear pore complex protein Nup160-like [Elysia marginata]|uniref:Nuclear pore complex protein Nup160-like n=1 Tax=Elysia marginata TaxID=1093978 RepID=A0AAV4EX41_9GAST|nr:nuclear pore complex protein Nup160-like [Elysia marginata]
MYERGLRLSQEVPGLRSLQQQAQSYLAALNSLYLVQREYAWIVKPVLRQQIQRLGYRDEDDSDETSRKSVKHDTRGHPKDRQIGPKKLEILELSDLQKDYLLLDARLRLIKNQPDSSLVSGQDSSSDAWEWLRENNIPPCGARETSAADKAWSLLQSYLLKLEDGSGRCHKCVAHTLLSQSYNLPTWLVNSYKRLDVSSLLRVYLTFDLLSEAASLACDYLEGVTDSLTGTNEPAFGLKMYQKVKDKIDKYQTKSNEMSREISAY